MTDTRVEINESILEAFLMDPEGPVGDIMERAAFAVENKAKLNLLEPGTGHTYDTFFAYVHYDIFGNQLSPSDASFYRQLHGGLSLYGGMFLIDYGSRPPHTASAPEESAASDTGELLGTVTHYMTEEDDGPTAHVGSPLMHALYTELGTRTVDAPEGEHKGMVERPWLRPALDAIEEVPLS